MIDDVYCPNCGTINSKYSEKCTGCGNSLKKSILY